MQRTRCLPSLLGETDIIKELRSLPGVNSGSEGAAGLIVRGSGPDQNLVLLDGVPIYNINHLSGFFSVFNTDALASAEMYKGAYPARYGGRISSVTDIRMREGNLNKFEGKISVGTIASKLTFEGPIIKNKASFILSARRTYLDLLSTPTKKR
jgi:outer membrane cobalamin receptor